jgi:hypothetical protein
MKQTLIIGAIIVLVGIAGFLWMQKDEVATTEPQATSVVGCYVARTPGKDVYTLNVQSQNGENVSGALAFKNFEKDSSAGTFIGTYKDGILLGDYAFRSEGMDSVTQVIFKKQGNDFVRGYGDVNGNGTRFTDLSKITYDASSVLSLFKKEACSM